MKPERKRLDPAVEEVLTEIASQRDSRLFLAPPEAFVRGCLDLGVQVGRSAPRLSNAERHLLAAHREEVAKLLLERAIDAVCEDPKSDYVYRPDPMGADELARRTDAAARNALGFREPAGEGLKLLEAVRDDSRPVGPAERQTLIAWSLRLADRPNTRVWASYEAQSRGSHVAALLLAKRVVESSPTPAVLNTAWQAFGLASYHLGRVDDLVSASQDALRLSLRAGLSPSSFAVPIVNLVLLSLDRRDGRSARFYFDLLDERVPVEDVALAGAVAKLRSLHGAKCTAATLAWRQCQERSQRLDRPSGRVGHALL
jgi:hypothetical protein